MSHDHVCPTDAGSPFELHVCVGCAALDRDQRAAGTGGGTALLEAILAEVLRRPFAAEVEISAFQCLGACGPRGRVSIASVGRWSIVFGGLDAVTDAGPLCDFIELWLAGRYGQTRKQDRPRAIRDKIIGRVPPPLHHLAGATPPSQIVHRIHPAPD